MEILKRLLLFSVICLATIGHICSKPLTRSDILNIPFINTLAPITAYRDERLILNVSLYVSYMNLEDKDSELRLRANLIWIVSWKDKRIEDIKDEFYYFNDGEIWSPEIHSITNEISRPIIRNYYTDTIVVKKNGEVQSTVFEDYETYCGITKSDIVNCWIGIGMELPSEFNYETIYACRTEDCIRVSEVYLQMSNESNKWIFYKTYVERDSSNMLLYTRINFKRNIEVTYHIVDNSPVIFILLILFPFLMPIYSKMRLEINALTYLMGIIIIVNVQFEFFTLNVNKKSELQLFYSVSLIFLSISWIWNSLASNIWTSCNHSFELASDSILGRTLSAKYLIWIIPTHVLESKSVLMKIIVLLDKIVWIFIGISLVCVLLYVDRIIRIWNASKP